VFSVKEEAAHRTRSIGIYGLCSCRDSPGRDSTQSAQPTRYPLLILVPLDPRLRYPELGKAIPPGAESLLVTGPGIIPRPWFRSWLAG